MKKNICKNVKQINTLTASAIDHLRETGLGEGHSNHCDGHVYAKPAKLNHSSKRDLKKKRPNIVK